MISREAAWQWRGGGHMLRRGIKWYGGMCWAARGCPPHRQGKPSDEPFVGAPKKNFPISPSNIRAFAVNSSISSHFKPSIILHSVPKGPLSRPRPVSAVDIPPKRPSYPTPHFPVFLLPSSFFPAPVTMTKVEHKAVLSKLSVLQYCSKLSPLTDPFSRH